VKTISLKKVSAVAVASLGFGLLSVVPAQAGAITTAAGGTVVTSISTPVRTSNTTWTATVVLSQTTAATPVAGDTYASTVAVTDPGNAGDPATATIPTYTLTAADLFSANVSKFSVVMTITAATASIADVLEASKTVAVTLTVGGVAAAAATTITAPALSTTGVFGPGVATGGSGSALTAGVNGQATVRFINGTADTSYTVTSSGVGTMLSATGSTTATVNLNATTAAGGVTWTPITNRQNLDILTTSAVAGTQTLTFQPIGTLGAPGIPVTATITWGSIAGLSTGGSIIRQAAYIAGDAQASVTPGAAFSTTVNATPIAVSKTAGTNASTIQVMLLNSDGTAAQQGNKVTASVKSGPGLITVSTTNTVTPGLIRAQTVTTTGTQNMGYVFVTADGAAGTGVIEISVTDGVTGATTVLGTRSVTFTGSVTTLTVSATNFNIGAAGKTTGASTAARLAATGELGDALNSGAANTTPAFVLATTDGTNAVSISSAAVPTVTSADTTVVSGGTCVQDTTDLANRTLIGQGGPVGFYNCSFTGGANAASGKSTVLTFKTPNPAVAGAFLSATATVTIGGTTVASEKISTDATTYTAGQQMVVTITAKDASGNPVADGVASPAVTANKALGTTSSALAAGFYAGGVNANAASVAKSSLFAPSLAGAFTLSATGTDTAKTKLSASASVTDGNASLLTQIDALNAKIVALNALIAKIMKKLGVK
jgi:hypothetical protein